MRVMVFGAFDLLHPGHLYLLYHARLRGEELVAVVARDAAVKRLKGKAPEWGERKRLRAVRATGLATKAVLGDMREGEYAVLKKIRPHMICLGYDQGRLKKDLREKMAAGALPRLPLQTIPAHRDHRWHTSLLRRKK